MAEHADHHHHVAEEKPKPNRIVQFGIFFGLVAIWVGLVGAIRVSQDMLLVGGLLGVAALALAVVGALFGKARGGTSRGFLAAVFMGVIAVTMWLVISPEI
jgi:hypothetical protein